MNEDDAWRLTDRDPHTRMDYVADLPMGLDEPGPNHPNVRALLTALDDPADEVRDWATFGLGVILDVDSPEIREALHRMLADPTATPPLRRRWVSRSGTTRASSRSSTRP